MKNELYINFLVEDQHLHHEENVVKLEKQLIKLGYEIELLSITFLYHTADSFKIRF
ncbi:hypothetical protein SH2C18_51670 [Clostridium sediminicola]